VPGSARFSSRNDGRWRERMRGFRIGWQAYLFIELSTISVAHPHVQDEVCKLPYKTNQTVPGVISRRDWPGFRHLIGGLGGLDGRKGLRVQDESQDGGAFLHPWVKWSMLVTRSPPSRILRPSIIHALANSPPSRAPSSHRTISPRQTPRPPAC
jgi:hypothetical protein